jgi:hypothetical protein
MIRSEQAKRIAGWGLHFVVGGIMIFAGVMKLVLAPPQAVETMTKLGLGGQLRLIGAGELVSAVLLLVPFTRSLGILLTSAFWGGVICIHMAHDESYLVPSVLLTLAWLGAWLRQPEPLGTVARHTQHADMPSVEPLVVE